MTMAFAKMDSVIVIMLGQERVARSRCAPTTAVPMVFASMEYVSATMVGWDMIAQKSHVPATL